jgi:hypothetical protein
MVALLTQWSTSGGLFFYLPEAQGALIVGIAAGLIGTEWVAAAVAAVAVIVGDLSGPTNLWVGGGGLNVFTLGWAALAGATAFGVSAVLRRRLVREVWVFWFAAALIIANGWATVIAVDSSRITDPTSGRTYSSIADSLTGDINGPGANGDEKLYAWLVGKMRSGVGYYEAFAQARPTMSKGSNGPTGIFNFREPLFYTAVASAPSPWLVIGALLLLMSLVVLLAVPLVRTAVKMPVVLPAMAALTSYTVWVGIAPLFTELWAGLLCLLAVELTALASRSARWRLLVVASVLAALTAFLVRELALAVLLAGVASAWFGPAEQKTFRIRVWAGAVAVGIAGFAAHAIEASRHVVPVVKDAAAHEGLALFQGGIGYALSGFAYSAEVFQPRGGPQWMIVALLAAIGVAGTFMLPDKDVRVMTWAVVGSILLLGLLAGNSAHTSEGQMNYWNLTGQFLVFASIPCAFALLPVARVRRSETGGSR